MLVQMNMIKSPDGKYGLISDMGFNQWLSLLVTPHPIRFMPEWARTRRLQD